MTTIKAWIVDVYRSVWDFQDGDVAWTEVYETEEEALCAAKAVHREYLFYHTEVYEDEVDCFEEVG